MYQKLAAIDYLGAVTLVCTYSSAFNSNKTDRLANFAVTTRHSQLCSFCTGCLALSS